MKKFATKKNIANNLLVTINSFSYKRGIPTDKSGNGGGFVFDCRALNNPGRLEEYKDKTGKHVDVIDFFKEDAEMEAFNSSVLLIVRPSIERYMERGFTNLMINFGCTGGQHRSVYCAEKMFQTITSRYNVKTQINHTEREFDNLT